MAKILLVECTADLSSEMSSDPLTKALISSLASHGHELVYKAIHTPEEAERAKRQFLATGANRMDAVLIAQPSVMKFPLAQGKPVADPDALLGSLCQHAGGRPIIMYDSKGVFNPREHTSSAMLLDDAGLDAGHIVTALDSALSRGASRQA